MENNSCLHEFGYNFLGPICSEYFVSLNQIIELTKPTLLCFLAREGYLFEKSYQSLCANQLINKSDSAYVYASRTFLFRISIGDRYTWQWSLGHGFEGRFQKLLTARFGFTLEQINTVFSDDELAQEVSLPEQTKTVEILLENHLAKLSALVAQSRTNYLDYLQSLGLTAESRPLFLDVGYSGTIQKLITRLLSVNTSGLYFITTASGDYPVNGYIASMQNVFKSGVKMGDGYTMLDRSLFLESLLTSPNGQFIDIRKNRIDNSFNFMFGRKAYAQSHFHELSIVHDGAVDAVVTAFKHNIRYSIIEVEALYEQFARKRNMIPRAAWPLFDVDDAISGNGNVDPLSFFGL